MLGKTPFPSTSVSSVSSYRMLTIDRGSAVAMTRKHMAADRAGRPTAGGHRWHVKCFRSQQSRVPAQQSQSSVVSCRSPFSLHCCNSHISREPVRDRPWQRAYSGPVRKSLTLSECAELAGCHHSLLRNHSRCLSRLSVVTPSLRPTPSRSRLLPAVQMDHFPVSCTVIHWVWVLSCTIMFPSMLGDT